MLKLPGLVWGKKKKKKPRLRLLNFSPYPTAGELWPPRPLPGPDECPWSAGAGRRPGPSAPKASRSRRSRPAA